MRKWIGLGIFALVVLLWVVAAHVRDSLHATEARKGSACAILDTKTFAHAANTRPSKVKMRPDSNENADDGPVTHCNYYIDSTDTEPVMKISIWCRGSVPKAEHIWEAQDHKNKTHFAVRQTFVWIDYYHLKAGREEIRSAAQRGQRKQLICPGASR